MESGAGTRRLLQTEILDRFRQPDVQHHGKRERDDAADPVEGLPARPRDRGDDDGGEGAARGHPHEHEHDEGRPGALRREFGVERRDVRKHAAEADAREKAQHHQLVHVRRHGAEDREHAEDERAEDHGHATAVAVAEPAEQRGADHHAERARREHGPELGRLDVPARDQRRCPVGCREQVVTVGEHDHEGEDDELDRERPDLLIVDQLRHVYGRRPLTASGRAGERVRPIKIVHSASTPCMSPLFRPLAFLMS